MLSEPSESKQLLINDVDSQHTHLKDDVQKKELYKTPQIVDQHHSYRNNYVRWIFLFFLTLSFLGIYVISACFTPLQSQIMDKFKMSNTKFNLLYTVQSFPNIFLAFLGGYFLDYIGLTKGLIILQFMATLGQVFLLIGLQWAQSYALLMIGSLLIGLCVQLITVAVTSIAIVWFRGKEVSFAFGTTVSASFIGSAINAQALPFIYASCQNFFWPYMFGIAFMVLSIITSFIMHIMDKVADKQEGVVNKSQIAQEDKPKLKDVKKFPILYWFVASSIMFSQASWVALANDQNSLLMLMFPKITNEVAGSIIAIQNYCGISAPLFGLIFDKIGCRGYAGVIGQFFIFYCLLGFMVLPQSSNQFVLCFALLMEMMGITIYQTGFWICVSMLIDDKHIATAYGIQSSFLGIGNSISPYVLGNIIDGTTSYRGGYFWGVVYCSCFTILSSSMALIMNIKDFRNKKICNRVKNYQVKSIKKSFNCVV